MGISDGNGMTWKLPTVLYVYVSCIGLLFKPQKTCSTWVADVYIKKARFFDIVEELYIRITYKEIYTITARSEGKARDNQLSTTYLSITNNTSTGKHSSIKKRH